LKRQFELEELALWLKCPQKYFYQYIEKAPAPLTELDAFNMAMESSFEAVVRENLDREAHVEMFNDLFSELLLSSSAANRNTGAARFRARTHIGVFHEVHKPHLPAFPWPGPVRETLPLDQFAIGYSILSVMGNTFIVSTDRIGGRSVEANAVLLIDTHRTVFEASFLRSTPRRVYELVEDRTYRLFTGEVLRDAIRGINDGQFHRRGDARSLCGPRLCRYWKWCRKPCGRKVP
jgi:hypothetical protein